MADMYFYTFIDGELKNEGPTSANVHYDYDPEYDFRDELDRYAPDVYMYEHDKELRPFFEHTKTCDRNYLYFKVKEEDGDREFPFCVEVRHIGNDEYWCEAIVAPYEAIYDDDGEEIEGIGQDEQWTHYASKE